MKPRISSPVLLTSPNVATSAANRQVVVHGVIRSITSRSPAGGATGVPKSVNGGNGFLVGRSAARAEAAVRVETAAAASSKFRIVIFFSPSRAETAAHRGPY